MAVVIGTVVVMAVIGLVFHYRANGSEAKAAKLRQYLLTDMTEHCLKGARSIHDSEPDQKNIDYCNCAMSRTFADISDTELEASNSSPLVRNEI